LFPYSAWANLAYVFGQGGFMKLWHVKLKVAQQAQLVRTVSSGVAPARQLNRAHILLMANEARGHVAMKDREISQALGVCERMIKNVRKQFCQEGLEAAIERSPQPDRPDKRRLDGAGEARLAMLACSSPPKGQARWTLNLLGGALVQLGVCESISKETVSQALKKKRAQALAR
jgi:hypothetical protein